MLHGGRRFGCVPRSAVVARTVPLRCWWCARRPADRQQRFRPKACAIVAVNSWRPFFSVLGKRTAWCCVVSCMFEADDVHQSCMQHASRSSTSGRACYRRGVHQGYFVLSFNAVRSCVGICLCRLAPSISAEIAHVRKSRTTHCHM